MEPRLLLHLTDEQREIQRVARDFAHREIAPYSKQWDRDGHFERSLVPRFGELGFLGMLIPEQYDGLGLDTATYLVALEEIATVDAAVAILMGVHNSLPTQMILKWGSEDQKQRFLRPMARGELLGAFALSEPESGSDAASLSTQAVRDGKDWIISGTKAWVSHGDAADVIIVMARTDAPGARHGANGIGAFIVTPDLPGFKVGKREQKMGMRASP
ncbi:MAG TPA: acyl-CoA dehydrogenase family protein, partial [Gemmatimonadaceae bacterium]|nr:acyl-CoA dehydrogenase family protein [Gemmatimonadaceae bacterium]